MSKITTDMIAKAIVSLITLFVLPLPILAIIENPSNYWAWVGVIFLARPVFAQREK